jgi:hypothetical protein
MAISLWNFCVPFQVKLKRRVACHVAVVPTDLSLFNYTARFQLMITHASYLTFGVQNRVVPHLTAHRPNCRPCVDGSPQSGFFSQHPIVAQLSSYIRWCEEGSVTAQSTE